MTVDPGKIRDIPSRPNGIWPSEDVIKVKDSVILTLQSFHLAGRLDSDIKNLNVTYYNGYTPMLSESAENWQSAEQISFSPQVDKMMLLLTLFALRRGRFSIDSRVPDIASTIANEQNPNPKEGWISLLLQPVEKTLHISSLKGRANDVLKEPASDAQVRTVKESEVGEKDEKIFSFINREKVVTIQPSILKVIAAAMTDSDLARYWNALRNTLGDWAADRFIENVTSITFHNNKNCFNEIW
ncbi:hypothetical protein FSARC_3919 [Fusarium sarcochroum]|uniref:Uncharacterized protein n=1 Tax=Fusarium sarcochroum TaxID=1208366 RepID=A0A8H4U2R9_9HYPO|nr:hypothetical protein FSARC_3919 [Fusarium sarcochroum]